MLFIYLTKTSSRWHNPNHGEMCCRGMQMVRRSAGCQVDNCDGGHIAAGMCHYGDGPHKAKGLCKGCYGKANRVYSERKLPHFHALMPDDVREIRHLHATGDYSQVELARKFGVSGKAVSLIVRRKTWTDLE